MIPIKKVLVSSYFFFCLSILVANCSSSMKPIMPVGTMAEMASQPYPTLSNTLPELIKALSSPQAEVRISAARLLIPFGPDAAPAVPALTQNLQYENSEVRRATVEALGAIGIAAKPAVPNLIVLLFTDTAVQPRRQVAIALGKIGDTSSVPALAECLNDEDMWVQMHCAESIAVLTGLEFSELKSTGYTLNNQGVPIIVVEAKEWWQNNGRYQIWIVLDISTPQSVVVPSNTP